MIQKIVIDGVIIEKRDGECAHPTCRDAIDFHQNDKPPMGWATLTFNRYAKKGGVAHKTFLLCPRHTVNFLDRQPTLVEKASKFVRTIIESPFAGDVAENLRFVRAIMRDCLYRKEAPYASHALYTQEGVLDDNAPGERTMGMEAGFSWSSVAQKVVVYTNRGISPGMERGIERHKQNGKIVEVRSLPGWKPTSSHAFDRPETDR
jgi:hypothetical protein